MALKKIRKIIVGFQEITRSHYHFAVSNRGNRDLGISLTVSGWLLFAFFFVLFENQPENLLPCCNFTDLFSQFTIFHFFMTFFFFTLCISKNLGRYKKKRTLLKHSFSCKKFSKVLLRAVFAIISVYSLALSRIWNPEVDNSILYITDAMWIWVLLRLSGIRLNKLSVVGIFLGTSSVLYMYFNNIAWSTPGGFIFGILSGFTLGVITILTSYLIEFVPVRIICFYHSVLGLVLSFILAVSIGGISAFQNIDFGDFVSLGISGITFSIALYSVIRAFHYLESYVIGALAFLFHVFIECIHYAFTQEMPSTITIIGTLGLLISALIILITTEAFSNTHDELYSIDKDH